LFICYQEIRYIKLKLASRNQLLIHYLGIPLNVQEHAFKVGNQGKVEEDKIILEELVITMVTVKVIDNLGELRLNFEPKLEDEIIVVTAVVILYHYFK